MPEQMQELVRYATLASNGHNTQPWKFALRNNSIEIHPDASRRLPVVDPQDRELWISLACRAGEPADRSPLHRPHRRCDLPRRGHFIQVRLAADIAESSPLFDAIPLRQSTRSAYDGQLVPTADLDRVQATPLEPGITLRFVTNPTDMATVVEYVAQGNLRQYADKAFVDDLLVWLRFNKRRRCLRWMGC